IVKLIKGEDTLVTRVNLQYNPASGHSAADRKQRYTTMMDAYNLLEELAWLDNMALEIGARTKGLADTIQNKALRAKSLTIAKRMEEIHAGISATQPGEGGLAGQVRLREQIAEVYGAVAGYEGKPTNVQMDALSKYTKEVADIKAELEKLIAGELNTYNQALAKQNLKPVTVTPKDAFLKR
ncbi:MAG TPA: hypothetical protein PKL06_08825, partial [Chitinophagales bacterium]|nr:hypothetical protein [Chitinophagales bacterium]